VNKQLVLASASPRRKELLDQLGVRYLVHPVDIDELPKQREEPLAYVVRIAAEKAAACLAELEPSLPILAADTSVVVDGQILGKPENKEHAIAMLNLLSGNIHRVYSAVSVRESGMKNDSRHMQAVSMTDVTFRTISQKEIQAYWQTGEPEGKAGAYAIQGLGGIFVASIRGSYSGVVGLPLFETAELLSKQGIKVIR
jgi:septum formation protein